MTEFVTQAIVLGVTSRNGTDRTVDLLTPAWGRLEARMVGGRAITSKFSPHCMPPNVVTVRLVKKNRYTLADALTEERFPALRVSVRALTAVLNGFAAIRALAPKEEPDTRLFHEVRRALAAGTFTVARALALMGYDPAHAHCVRCRKRAVAYFVPREGVFLCRACFVPRGNEVVLETT